MVETTGDRTDRELGRGGTRRMVLLGALAAPALVYGSAASAQAVCVDLKSLPSGQRSMRAALNFQMASDDAKRRCGGCAFYTAVEGSCGKCQIFNGPVPAEGRCDSWAARK